jgi:hypothetical protein
VLQIRDVGEERTRGCVGLPAELRVLVHRELIDQRCSVRTGLPTRATGDTLRQRVRGIDVVQIQPGLQIENCADLLGSDPSLARHDPIGEHPTRCPTDAGTSVALQPTTIEHVVDSRTDH